MTFPEQILCAYLCACGLGLRKERELEHGIGHRQESSIGVGLRGQSHVAVPHDFHRHARRGACAGEVCGQRVPQGMEVCTLPGSIEKRNAGGLQIHFEPRHGRHDSGEDSRGSGGQFGDMVAHLRDKLRMEGDDGLLVVFRGGSADIDKRLLAFQMKVRSFQRGQLTPTQASVNGGEIDHFSLSRDAKETLHFIVGEGTAGTYLPSVGLHLLDVLERIAGDALVFFHPV